MSLCPTPAVLRWSRYRRPLRRAALVAGAAALALAPTGVALAQSPVPQASEFRANAYTSGNQRYQSVGMDASGGAVVAWTSDGQDGSSFGVYAQRYSPDGTPQGGEFQVNTTTVSFQAYPSVALAADGTCLIVWQSLGQDGNQFGVYAQRYGPDGMPQGGEFRVNTTTAGSQGSPAVAMGADGASVVTWSTDGQDGSGFGIYAQRYSPDGTPNGGEFQVNTHTAGMQTYPAVAVGAGGAFVVAWQSEGQDGSGQGIYAQRFASDGTAAGVEIHANEYTDGNQADPSVAMDANGTVVIAWSSEGQDGDGNGIYARRYTADGASPGGEFQVHTTTALFQSNPAVSMNASGDAVIVWGSDEQDGSSYGVFARSYGPDGAPRSGEFQVNTTTTSFQGFPAVSLAADGGFLVVWESMGQDGSAFGVYAQRYTPAAVASEPGGTEPMELALAPNPVGSDGGRITYTLAASQPVRLAVFDVLGREVALLTDGEQPAGPHAVALDVTSLTPGLYVVHLTAGTDRSVRRMTVTR